MKSMEKPQHHKKEAVNKESHGKHKVEHSSDLIEYLNKARQGGVEYEGIYRHVIGKGSLDGDSYPKSLINRPDLLEKFAVGKNGEPYQNTRDAAHDLIEFLANEAEGKIKQQEVETREKTKHQKIKKEIDSQKDLLELLNKARQNSIEHEDVYWYVFGKGSTSKIAYPDSLINRPDLLEKFAVGKNGEPYQNTRDAAHDLIEFLANEAEGKIKQFTLDDKSEPTPPTTPKPEPDKEKEKEKEKTPEGKDRLTIILITLLEKAKGGDAESIKILIEFVITHKIEITIKTESTPEEIEAQRILIILLEKIRNGDITVITELITFISIHVITITIIEIAPPTPESISSLDEKRDAYLKAKRLRGNVFRGGFGRFFKRKLNFGAEEMDFGGKKGATDLEKVRKEYQEGLSQYRSTELRKTENDVSERLRRGEITPATANAEMQTKIIGLLSEEQANIDNKSVTGIEKNMFEKMKTWYRRNRGKLMLGGIGLAVAGGLTGGTALGAGILGARTAMGTVGTYVSVEEGLGKYSKWLGDRGGLIKTIDKKLKEITKGSIYSLDPAKINLQINNYLDTIPVEDLKKEAARLRMLQVEKGVSIDNLNTKASPFGNNRRIAALIIKRDNELTAQEAMNTAHLDPALVFTDRLSNRLSLEVNARNEITEKEVDKERIKKMFRKTTAALAGGAVGWLIGGELFQHHDATPASSPNHIPTPEHAQASIPTPEHIVPPDLHTVTSGENLWKIFESTPSIDHTMTGLSRGAKDVFLDTLKDIYEKMSPPELISHGIQSGVVDNLQPGWVIDISKAVDPGILAQTLSTAKGLSRATIESVLHNRHEIATWLANPTNHASLTGALNSSVIDEILRGAR